MAAEDVQEVLDDAVELVGDTVDLVEGRVSWIAQNPKGIAIVVSLMAVAVGGALGYKIAEKRLALKYQQIAEEEISQIKERYTIPREFPDANKPPLESVAMRAQAERIVKENGYTAYDKAEPIAETTEDVQAEETGEEVVEVHNIFDSADPDTYFNMDEEVRYREEHPNDPYIITSQEYDANETDFEQVQLTYYDGDDVLADERDEVVKDVEGTVGSRNLLRFGHGTRDRRTVYVRNSRLRIDIEVVQSDGKFSEEVLGFRPEDLPRSRTSRMLRDDD